MDVKDFKKHLLEFPRYKDGKLGEVLGNLHKKPYVSSEFEFEPLRAMYRLFGRFIDLAEGQPVDPLRPTHSELCRKVEKFIKGLKLPSSMDIREARRKGKKGLAFYALTNVFAFFINYREMEESYSYYPFEVIEDMTIRDFKEAVKNFIEPTQEESRFVWELNLGNPALNAICATSCHAYLLNLYAIALNMHLGKPHPDLGPNLKTIREDSFSLLDKLPWPDFDGLEYAICSHGKGAALAIMHETILNFHSLSFPSATLKYNDVVGRILRNYNTARQ